VVDPGRIRRLLESLEDYRTRLAELAQLPPDRYEDEERFAGRYLVQASAQICIDIANHLISSEGWRVPQDFRDAFTVLEERGLLDEGLANRLRALAGLRNRLVHLYEEIDDALVHQAIREGLGDLNQLALAVGRFVESQAR
jgi:uncharacterized protein YutE (UPF0331/DUF86 family)